VSGDRVPARHAPGADSGARRRASLFPERAVWVDGRLCRGADAKLSLFDRGARDGEGLFETFRVEGGRPIQWERHLERLVLSAAELGFPVPPAPANLRAALDQVLAAGELSDAVARLTVTRGIPGQKPARAGAWLEAEPLEARLWRGTRAGAASAIVSRTAFEPGALGRHKTTSRLAYHLAREEARAARADEALLVDAGGELLEGTVSNLFLIRAGEILSPPLARGILPGIARATVFRAGARLGWVVREARLEVADLARAEATFVTNSVQEVVPLAKVDDRSFPGDARVDRLKAAARELAIAE
jgi:branched-subunit amino acid aminotransferase/4-amino-4-deoxychorismate lyase